MYFNFILLSILSSLIFGTKLPDRWERANPEALLTSYPTSNPLDIDNFVFIDNGIIKLGVDTNRGGAIGYLSLSKDNSSYTNTHDFGRLVQGSFYSGPVPYDPQQCNDPSWSNWPWNPIGGGDAFGNPAKVLSINKTSATSMEILTIPYQWACNDVPCECTFRQEITLIDNAAEVRLTLNNNRTDIPPGALYSSTQELPAIYIIGQFCNLYTYNGTAPFTSQEPGQLPTLWPWGSFSPSEHWMAYSNGTDLDNSISVGVWTPFFNHAGAGRYFSNITENCVGGPYDDPVGYIAPWISEILDSKISYQYNFSLIVDTVRNIQQYATIKHNNNLDESLEPNYYYGKSTLYPMNTRAHCTFSGQLRDGGWPIPDDGLIFPITNYTMSDMVLGPLSLWDANNVPILYLNVSYSVSTTLAIVFQIEGSGNFCPTCQVTVPVTASSSFQIIAVNLSSNNEYTGHIVRIGYVPTIKPTNNDNDTVQLRSISYIKPQL